MLVREQADRLQIPRRALVFEKDWPSTFDEHALPPGLHRDRFDGYLERDPHA